MQHRNTSTLYNNITSSALNSRNVIEGTSTTLHGNWKDTLIAPLDTIDLFFLVTGFTHSHYAYYMFLLYLHILQKRNLNLYEFFLNPFS